MNRAMRATAVAVFVLAATAAAVVAVRHHSTASAQPAVRLVAAQLPGFRAVTDKSASDSSMTHVVVADCPERTVVVGGFAEIRDGATGESEISVHGSATQPYVKLASVGPMFNPYTGRYGYRVGAVETTAFSGSWYVRAVAYCAPAPAGYEFITQTNPRTTASNKFVTRDCGPGRVPLAVGGGIVSSTPGSVARVTLRDFILVASATTHGAVVNANAESPVAAWTLYLNMACANPLSGYTVVDGSTGYSVIDKTAWITCPAGTRVYSLMGRVSLEASAHLSGYGIYRATQAYVMGANNVGGTRTSWSVGVRAICAR